MSSSDPTNAAPVKPVGNVFVTVQTDVKERIKQSGSAVREAVISGMVQTEIRRRTDLLTKAIETRDRVGKSFDKIRPDNKFYTLSPSGGKVANETWSEGALKKRDEHANAMRQLDEQIDKAIEGDWSKLQQAVANAEKFLGGKPTGDQPEEA